MKPDEATQMDIEAHINVLRTAVASNLAQCPDLIKARQILDLADRHLKRAEALSAPHLVAQPAEDSAA